MGSPQGTARCILCQRMLAASKMRPRVSVRTGISELIAHDDPADYRGIYVARLLERERGELRNLEKQVVESLQTGQILLQKLLDDNGVLACFVDRVAAFGSSWTFILLNLARSSLAALQASVIRMSQQRQETKDRAGNDYRVTPKAALEIHRLHEKIHHHLAQQWDRLAEMQPIQIEILQERANENR
jgi:uncharacterized membrane protein